MGRPPQSGRRWLIATDARTCTHKHAHRASRLPFFFSFYPHCFISFPPPPRPMLVWIVAGSEFKACGELSWFMPPELGAGRGVYSVAGGLWTVGLVRCRGEVTPSTLFFFFPTPINGGDGDRTTASSSRTNWLARRQRFFLLCGWRCIIYL